MSNQSLFNAALKAARRRGVTIRQNVRKCCRSCIVDADLGLMIGDTATVPYAFTFGGQGQNYSWRDDRPVHLRKRRGGVIAEPVSIYFNHANGGAEILADELRKAGLTVEWDGSEYRCVVVHFPVEEEAK